MSAVAWLLVFAVGVALWWVVAAVADTHIGVRAAGVVHRIRQPVRAAVPHMPSPARAVWHRARTEEEVPDAVTPPRNRR